MGTNCAPLVAVLLWERFRAVSTIIRMTLFRFLNCIMFSYLNIDNPYSKQMVSRIYPTALQLNKAYLLGTEAPPFWTWTFP